MGVEVFWKLPVSGDGRTFDEGRWTRGDYRPVVTPQSFARTGRASGGHTYLDQLVQIARAVEFSGFDGLLVPQSADGEEPLILAGALARDVRRITLAPQLPAHFLSAVYAAKISTSFQRLTGGRLALNLIAEAPGAAPWHGHKWSEAELIARTDEFLDVFKGVWLKKPFTYHGRFYEVENGGFDAPLLGQPLPTIVLAGDSAEALALSAKHADVHVFPADTLEKTQERIATLKDLAAAQGRAVRVALDAEIVVRHTDEEAWAYLRRRWNAAAPNESFEQFKSGPHLWAGFDKLRKGVSGGFVGEYGAVSEHLAAYIDAGVSSFFLSANPHLEEAYRIGEQLLPPLRERVRLKQQAAA